MGITQIDRDLIFLLKKSKFTQDDILKLSNALFDSDFKPKFLIEFIEIYNNYIPAKKAVKKIKKQYCKEIKKLFK